MEAADRKRHRQQQMRVQSVLSDSPISHHNQEDLILPELKSRNPDSVAATSPDFSSRTRDIDQT